MDSPAGIGVDIDAALRSAAAGYAAGSDIQRLREEDRLSLRLKDVGTWRLSGSATGVSVEFEAGGLAQEQNDHHSEAAGTALVSTDYETLSKLGSGTLSPMAAVTSQRLKISLNGMSRDAVTRFLPILRQAGRSMEDRVSGAFGDLTNLQARIVSDALVTDNAGYSCVVYDIEVSLGPMSWVVQKRFSNFHSLKESLGTSMCPDASFPGKVPKQFMLSSQSSMKRRRDQLEVWLAALVTMQPLPLAAVVFLEIQQRDKAAVLAASARGRVTNVLRRSIPFDAYGRFGREQLLSKLRHLEDEVKRQKTSSALPTLLVPVVHVLARVLATASVLVVTSQSDLASWRGLVLWAIVCLFPVGQLMIYSAMLLMVSWFMLEESAWWELPAYQTCCSGNTWLALLVTAVLAKSAKLLASKTWRSVHIWSVASLAIGSYIAAKILCRSWRLNKAQSRAIYRAVDTWMAPFIAKNFAQLGSVWVKIGQYVSGRADMTPKVWQDAFTILQCDMPNDGMKDVSAQLKDSFGEEWRFEDFEWQSIASASIAQVHRAELKDSRKVVAVKIMHRGIADIFRSDMTIAVKISRIIARLNSDWEIMLSVLLAWAREIEFELDFEHEVQNMRDVRRILLDKHEANVIVPAPVEHMVSKQAFAMNFIPNAFKVDDLCLLSYHGVDKAALVEQLAHLWCLMLFQEGIFNADPHPGNVMVQLTDEGAKPVLLDWGWVVRLEPDILEGYRDLVIGLDEYDTAKAVDALRRVGYESTQDSRAPERSVEFFAYLFRNTGSLESAQKSKEEFYHERRAQKKKDEDDGVYEKGGRKPTKIPDSFLFLTRVVGLLRGLCTTLEVEVALVEIMALHARLGKLRTGAAENYSADGARPQCSMDVSTGA